MLEDALGEKWREWAKTPIIMDGRVRIEFTSLSGGY
jgi:hypothetical protein